MPGIRLALLALLAVGLAGCATGTTGSSDSTSSTGYIDPAAVSAEDLDGSSFTSTRVSGHDLVAGTTVHLEFADGRMTANAGCNTMSGGFSVTAGKLAWTGQPVSTMMGCDDARSAQDRWLSQLLTTGVAATGDPTAVLSLIADPVTMTLERSTPTDASTLLGTSWTVTGYSDGTTASTVAEGLAKPTVAIAEDGALTVDTGCNTGRSTVKASGSTLTVGPLATTRKACTDDRAVAVEAAVVQVLDGTVEVTVEGRTATFTHDGRSLTLTES